MQTFEQIIAQIEKPTFPHMFGEFLYHNRDSQAIMPEKQLQFFLNSASVFRSLYGKSLHFKKSIFQSLEVYGALLDKNNHKFKSPQAITEILGKLYNSSLEKDIIGFLSTKSAQPIYSQSYFLDWFYKSATHDSDTDQETTLLNFFKNPLFQNNLTSYFKNYEILIRAHKLDNSHIQRFVLDTSYEAYKSNVLDFAHLPTVLSLLVASQEIVYALKKKNKIELVEFMLKENLPFSLGNLQELDNLKNNYFLKELLPSLFKKHNITSQNIQQFPACVQSEVLFYHLLSETSSHVDTQKIVHQLNDRAFSIYQVFLSINNNSQKVNQILEYWELHKEALEKKLAVLSEARFDISQLMVITNSITFLRPNLTRHRLSYTANPAQKTEDLIELLAPFQENVLKNETRALDYYGITPECLTSFEKPGQKGYGLSEPELVFGIDTLVFYFNHLEKIGFSVEQTGNNKLRQGLQKKYSKILTHICGHFLEMPALYRYEKLKSEEKEKLSHLVGQISRLIQSPIFLADNRQNLLNKFIQKTQDLFYHNASFLTPQADNNLYSLIISSVDTQTNSGVIENIQEIKSLPTVKNQTPFLIILGQIEDGINSGIEKYKLDKILPKSDNTASPITKSQKHKI